MCNFLPSRVPQQETQSGHMAAIHVIRVDVYGRGLSSHALQQMVKKNTGTCSGAPGLADILTRSKETLNRAVHNDEVSGWLSTVDMSIPTKEPINPW